MIVLKPDRKEVATEKELAAEFQRHCDDGYRQFVLVSDEGAYLSAIGEGFGPYTLEWFPGTRAGSHLRACEDLKSREVMEALLGFFREGPSWRGSLAWEETEDEPSPLPARWMESLDSIRRPAPDENRGESGSPKDSGRPVA
ncbi:hypothetical protein OJF2_44210 [Aquisphaera giovannonii]|uniref:Uncharacterized protein n=1 Tax=Aquisphaera giovannonii TaxID=406548 RepID=A0A5B9W6L4_9BACT|nr:hypothetical protein [Aquisphaera giovannonii]QEH35864.1 hypothetical protein OJF2_44210 [Aquisphaera giovannonii]